MAMLLLLSVSVSPAAAPDPRAAPAALPDLARFKPYLALDLEHRQEVVNRFRDFMNSDLVEPDSEVARRAAFMSMAIRRLRNLKSQERTDDQKWCDLRDLRLFIGPDAYYRGVIPELYPASYRAAFHAYLARRGLALRP
ncbi:MAG: hypothetical protein ACRC33_14470 [Gemmataceae bacterium]